VSTTEPVTVDDFDDPDEDEPDEDESEEDESDEDEPEPDEPELDEPSPEPLPPVPLVVFDVPPEPDTTALGDGVAAIELEVEVW
jgi:hypothetical protein